MSFQSRLGELITAIGADIKQLRADVAAAGGGGSGAWSEEVKTTNYTNSTTTASDIFTGFDPVDSGRYLLEATLAVFAAAATTGVQVGVSGPGPVVYTAMKVVSASAVATDLVYNSAINVQQPAVASLTTPTILQVTALLEFGTGLAAGNVRLQGKSEVAGSLITVRAGSMMRWRKLN